MHVPASSVPSRALLAQSRPVARLMPHNPQKQSHDAESKSDADSDSPVLLCLHGLKSLLNFHSRHLIPVPVLHCGTPFVRIFEPLFLCCLSLVYSLIGSIQGQSSLFVHRMKTFFVAAVPLVGYGLDALDAFCQNFEPIRSHLLPRQMERSRTSSQSQQHI